RPRKGRGPTQNQSPGGTAARKNSGPEEDERRPGAPLSPGLSREGRAGHYAGSHDGAPDLPAVAIRSGRPLRPGGRLRPGRSPASERRVQVSGQGAVQAGLQVRSAIAAKKTLAT